MPPGHYYSPIVDIDLLRAQWAAVPPAADLSEIDLHHAAQWDFFRELAQSFDGFSLPETPTPGHRYYRQNWFFDYGDAVVYAALIARHRPRRIIEVGSGFSSAVALDITEQLGLKTEIVFIEPDPDRLQSLVLDRDAGRYELIKKPLQMVGLERFSRLEPGDILFIDSTHVAKTGSDVLYEILEILPRLAPGVLIHFHDVFANFEYPDAWIFGDNRSWNETYFLRAFLSNNDRYRILLMTDIIRTLYRDRAMMITPRFVDHTGAGMWLMKIERADDPHTATLAA